MRALAPRLFRRDVRLRVHGLPGAGAARAEAMLASPKQRPLYRHITTGKRGQVGDVGGVLERAAAVMVVGDSQMAADALALGALAVVDSPTAAAIGCRADNGCNVTLLVGPLDDTAVEPAAAALAAGSALREARREWAVGRLGPAKWEQLLAPLVREAAYDRG